MTIALASPRSVYISPRFPVPVYRCSGVAEWATKKFPKAVHVAWVEPGGHEAIATVVMLPSIHGEI